ncbi:hypothetical protein ACHAXT_005601 [Thalassiosira profunda]
MRMKEDTEEAGLEEVVAVDTDTILWAMLAAATILLEIPEVVAISLAIAEAGTTLPVTLRQKINNCTDEDVEVNVK